MTKYWDFSEVGLARVVLVTILGTLLCLAVALACVSYTTQFMDEPTRKLTYIVSVLIPLFLSAPICYFFASKLRELAIAHQQLMAVASQDSLTTCLNRGAFVTLVDAYLFHVKKDRSLSQGALLMLDVDHFKSINDRYGHSTGDDALRLIATSIKSKLRSSDLLGRVGGEEFAVFLPQTAPREVGVIAERIRLGVDTADFRPKGTPEHLSISIGGSLFSGPVSFDHLFKVADERLYDAKRHGRNRVEFEGLESLFTSASQGSLSAVA